MGTWQRGPQDNALWEAGDEDDLKALADFAQEYTEIYPAATPEAASEDEAEFEDDVSQGDAETEEYEDEEYEDEPYGDEVDEPDGGVEPALPVRSCFRCLDDYEAEPGQDYCPACRADLQQLPDPAGQAG
jgi:rubrerythrin